ncbi:MAG: Holliday junction branch migration protein RuvA [bacterium]
MIGSIKGKIILQKDKFVIVEQGGIGYKIYVSTDTLDRLAHSTGSTSSLQASSEQNETNSFVSFWIHTHIKEDAQDLYGFLEYDELEFFEMLIGVSGIGPKGALTILSVAPIEILKKAIGTGDTMYLTKISGIGRKTAEKMVIELRDKVGKENESGSMQQDIDVMEALKSLGYTQNETREALKKVSSEIDLNSKIKEALKILGKK